MRFIALHVSEIKCYNMKCVLLLYRSQWYTECEQIDKNDRVYPHL